MDLENKKKRKRSGKTSMHQYELYLDMMQNDQIFRTGKINPTVSPYYIDNVWSNLTSSLNSTGDGPSLTPEEWKKRFNDWKNTTRAKYRKLITGKKRTGGGPAEDVSLTAMEERGLAVWGKIAVTGSRRVQVTGGLQQLSSSSSNLFDVVEEVYTHQPPTTELQPPTTELQPLTTVTIAENAVPAVEMEEPLTLKNTASSQEEAVNPCTSKQYFQNKYKKCRSGNQMQPSSDGQTIKSIGQDLLIYYKKSVEDNSNTLAPLEKERLNIEKQRFELDSAKFQFEVAKYKFENPNFEFNM